MIDLEVIRGLYLNDLKITVNIGKMYPIEDSWIQDSIHSNRDNFYALLTEMRRIYIPSTGEDFDKIYNYFYDIISRISQADGNRYNEEELKLCTYHIIAPFFMSDFPQIILNDIELLSINENQSDLLKFLIIELKLIALRVYANLVQTNRDPDDINYTKMITLMDEINNNGEYYQNIIDKFVELT